MKAPSNSSMAVICWRSARGKPCSCPSLWGSGLPSSQLNQFVVLLAAHPKINQKNLQVKWIWPEATKYTVLCLPAFSPELSGREAEEGATVAKEAGCFKLSPRPFKDCSFQSYQSCFLVSKVPSWNFWAQNLCQNSQSLLVPNSFVFNQQILLVRTARQWRAWRPCTANDFITVRWWKLQGSRDPWPPIWVPNFSVFAFWQPLRDPNKSMDVCCQ